MWKIYPIIAHLPILLLLCLYYRKKFSSALAAVTTAYLCCQPAKYFGILCITLTHSYIAEQFVRIGVLLISGAVSIFYLAPYLSQIFQKNTRSVCIFGFIPVVYYLFEYITGVFTGIWLTNSEVVTEFLPFFLCVVFMVFCVVYYKEYEQKADAERKEHIIQIAVEQQANQIDAVKRCEQEIRLIRHDLRLFLNSLMVCVENGDEKKIREMITSYTSLVDGAKLEYFCENDTLNGVLSYYSAKCKNKNIPFFHTVEIEKLNIDEILFASIVANALDNALNSQEELPAQHRSIKLLLKNSDGKLLFSVKNPVSGNPVFVDGLPVTDKRGHGYGTQSIRYMTERLGGNSRFSVQDGQFVVQVIL